MLAQGVPYLPRADCRPPPLVALLLVVSRRRRARVSACVYIYPYVYMYTYACARMYISAICVRARMYGRCVVAQARVSRSNTKVLIYGHT